MDWVQIYCVAFLAFYLFIFGYSIAANKKGGQYVFTSIMIMLPMIGRVLGWW